MNPKPQAIRPGSPVFRGICGTAGRQRGCLRLAVPLLVLLLAAVASGGAPGDPKSNNPPSRAGSGVVNMEFRDTDLPTVLRTLCQGAGVDFVLDPSVKGNVTAKLRNTSWENALEIILKSHGLESRRQNGTLLISPAAPAPDAALRPKEQRVVVKARPDGKLDFDASGAEISDAVRELAAVAEMNIVASKDISGTVTASLHGLPAEEILLAIADSCGATVSDKGNVIRVVPRPVEVPEKAGAPTSAQALEAKAPVEVKRLTDGRLAIHAKGASVRKLLTELAAASELNIVAAPELAGTIDLDLQNITAQDALAAIAAHSKLTFRPIGSLLYAAPAPPAVQTETFKLRYAEAKQIGEIMTKSIEGARVAIEPTNNLVIVTGTPNVIATARQIIERVEVAPVQVTIETRILETNLKGDEKLGITWSESFEIQGTCPKIPHSYPLRHSKEVTSSSYLVSYDPTDSRTRTSIGPDDTKAREMAVPYASPNEFQYGFLTCSGLKVILNALETKTSTRLLANPTLTTVENKEATINIVTKFPIAQYQVSSETGLLTVSGFEYKEFGTILKVTPRVNDGQIILDVHPEVSRQAGTTLFQGAELPIISSQETHTRVQIKDGNTLVIAGLIREETENVRRGVPSLSRIPLIGLLFRSHRAKLDMRRNLLIFITPHIVREADFARSARLRQRRTEPLPTADKDEEEKKQPPD